MSLGACLLGFGLLRSTFAIADNNEVLVVRSSDSGAYMAAEKAYSATVGRPIKSVSLATAKESQVRDIIANTQSFVLALGSNAATLVRESKSGSQALYAMVPNPEKLGLDGSAAVPMYASPLRQLTVAKRVVPNARRVGVMYDPSESEAMVRECEAAARSVGLTLVKEVVSSRQDVARAARALVGKVDLVWLVPDRTVISAETFRFIVETSVSTRVPVLAFSAGMVKAGALVAVEAEPRDVGVQAAIATKLRMSGSREQLAAPEGKVYLNVKSAELIGVSLSADARSGATLY